MVDMSASCFPSQATGNDIYNAIWKIYTTKRNIIRNREPIRTICCLLFIERIRQYGSLFFLAEYVSSYFDSSTWHCLVDRACGDTKWTPHGMVLADCYNTRTDRAVGYNWTAVDHWTR